MIHGIGCDIVSHARIALLVSRYGDKFASKLLAESEYQCYRKHRNPVAFIAKRFAAKEAFAKAIGTGFRDGLMLKHIAIKNDALGAPLLVLTGKAAALLEAKQIQQHHVSLSDEKEYSLAYVILSS